jgi:hypothetical protein
MVALKSTRTPLTRCYTVLKEELLYLLLPIAPGYSTRTICFCAFAGLSLVRSAGLEPATFSVRSQTHSRTGGDRERHGETKPRFYQNWALLEGQGRTERDMGSWYRCGTKGLLTYSIGAVYGSCGLPAYLSNLVTRCVRFYA